MKLRVELDGGRTDAINVGDPSRTVVARITVQPGAQLPWHTHPGPVLATVVTGELTYVYASDCVEREYGEDTTFVDPGRGNVHTAFSSSAGETEIIAVFFEATEDGPLTITEGVEPPEDCDVGPATTPDHWTPRPRRAAASAGALVVVRPGPSTGDAQDVVVGARRTQ